MIACISIVFVAIIAKIILEQCNSKLAVLPVIAAAIILSLVFTDKYLESVDYIGEFAPLGVGIKSIMNLVLIGTIGEKLSDAAGERGLSALIRCVSYSFLCITAIDLFREMVEAIESGGFI